MVDKNFLKSEFQRAIEGNLPDIIRNSPINIRKARILSFNQADYSASIRLDQNNEVIERVPVSKSLGTLLVGDIAMVISIDPRVSNSLYIIAAFSGTLGTIQNLPLSDSTISNSSLSTSTWTGGTIVSPTINNPVISGGTATSLYGTFTGFNNHSVKMVAGTTAGQLNLKNNVWTKVTLANEKYDPDSDFASSTYTVGRTGYYLVNGQVSFTNIVANKAYDVGIYVDGSLTNFANIHASDATQAATATTTDIKFLTPSDTVELYARSHAGVNTVDILGNNNGTYLAIHLLSI